MEFIAAETGHLLEINELIVESRSVWNYQTDYAQASLPFIQVDECYLESNLSFEIRDPELVGFMAFVRKEDGIYLDHLWIKKAKLRKGLGTAALDFADRLTLKYGWSKITVYPDPPAEGFYLKMGYVDTGKRLPSRIKGGPIFSVFEKAADIPR